MFAQTGDGGENSWKTKQTCYKCGEKGHIARGCPLNQEKQDQMHATIEEEAVADKEDTDEGENIFVQKKEGGVVDRKWVLLDSQSTVDQIANHAMLANIRKAKNPSKIHCNAGSTCSVLEGNFGSLTVKHSPYLAQRSKATSPSDIRQRRSWRSIPSAHQPRDRGVQAKCPRTPLP